MSSTTSSSPSSSSPLFSTPSQSSNGDETNPSTGTSSSLYLFTFLATLLLLLAVSCAIVVRSFVIRRRFRRRVQEALASGALSPYNANDPRLGGFGGGGGRRRRDFGEKPKLTDAYVAPTSEIKGGIWYDERWEAMKPVSVKIISEKHHGNGLAKQISTSHYVSPRRNNDSDDEDSTSGSTDFGPRAWFQSIIDGAHHEPRRRRVSRPRSTASTRPVASQSNPSDSVNSLDVPATEKAAALERQRREREMQDVKLQVSVLIEMPTPHHVHRHGGRDEGIPDMSFGVAEVPWRAPLHGEDEEYMRPSSST